MLASQRSQLAQSLLAACAALADRQGKSLGELNCSGVEGSLEKPKQPEHGDIASNIALRLAKPLAMSPPQIAAQLVTTLKTLPISSECLQSIEVAGPGFINFRLLPKARASVLLEVARAPDQFGITPMAADAPEVLVEFVSANPTGPLHVGHGRQAALGDSLAAILTATGLKVSREFYYNDAGAQIQNLAMSVQARAKGILPDDSSVSGRRVSG